MKLYEVHLEYKLYVVIDEEKVVCAESEAEAVAKAVASEALPEHIDVLEIERKNEIDPSYRGSIPHGVSGSKKTEDYVE